MLTNANTASKASQPAPTPIQSNRLVNDYFNSFTDEPYHFSEFNTVFKIPIYKLRQSIKKNILKCIYANSKKKKNLLVKVVNL